MPSHLGQFIVPIAQAIVVGVLVGLSILGIGLKFGGALTSIKHSVSDISNSVNKMEDQIVNIDFKEMEKTIARLEWILDNDDRSQGSNNSVKYHLDKSNIDVIISLISADQADTGLESIEPRTDEEYEEELADLRHRVEEDEIELPEGLEPEDVVSRTEVVPLDVDEATVVQFEYSHRIDTKYLNDELTSNRELAEWELELFDGSEPTFEALSPFETQFVVPTSDYDNVAEWIERLLRELDDLIDEMEKESDIFDRVVIDRLDDGMKV